MHPNTWAELAAKSAEKNRSKSKRRVSAGIYPVVVSGAWFGMSKSEKPMLRVTYVITEGEFAGEALNHYLLISTPRDVKRIESTFRALDTDPYQNVDADLVALSLIGKRGTLHVSWDNEDARYPNLEVSHADA